MNVTQKANIIERNIEQASLLLDEMRREKEQLVEDHKRLNAEMPRKWIAKMLDVDESTVYRMRERGELKSYKLVDVNQYMKENR